MGIISYVQNKIDEYKTQRYNKRVAKTIDKVYNMENGIDKIIGDLESECTSCENTIKERYAKDGLAKGSYHFMKKIAEYKIKKDALLKQKDTLKSSRICLMTTFGESYPNKNNHKNELLNILEQMDEGWLNYSSKLNN